MKYKLKQDMPGIPAGTILRLSKHGRLIQDDDINGDKRPRISSTISPEDYSEWFEPVQDKSAYWLEYWKTQEGKDELISKGKRLLLTDDQSQMVLQAIEELLRYIDTPIPDKWRTAAENPKDKDYPSGNYIAKADEARKALQEK